MNKVDQKKDEREEKFLFTLVYQKALLGKRIVSQASYSLILSIGRTAIL